MHSLLTTMIPHCEYRCLPLGLKWYIIGASLPLMWITCGQHRDCGEPVTNLWITLLTLESLEGGGVALMCLLLWEPPKYTKKTIEEDYKYTKKTIEKVDLYD
jgi:hypothetical protein